MKKILLLVSFFTITTIVILSNSNSTNASSTLPNDANAGAPMDNAGQTCTSCHGGTATQTTGIITTNIPASGFIGGTTYSVSVTMSGASAYGFELTPQTSTSNVGLGTWIAGTGSSVSAKYIKQSTKKTGTSAVWTFSWTAPTTATAVTFYGAFNYANNNNTLSGDIIKTSSATFLANTTAMEDISNANSIISVFPNPALDHLNISVNEILLSGIVTDLEGKTVKVLSQQELVSKTILLRELPNGGYFLQFLTPNNQTYRSKFAKME